MKHIAKNTWSLRKINFSEEFVGDRGLKNLKIAKTNTITLLSLSMIAIIELMLDY